MKNKTAKGAGVPADTIYIGIGNQSAILTIGGSVYDLRGIDLSQFNNIVIDGVTFKKVNENENRT